MSSSGIVSFLIMAAGLHLVLAPFLFIFQSRLIYFPNFPSREIIATPARVGLFYEAATVVTDDGVSLEGR